MEGKFTAVFEKREKFWIGYVEEIPGANTQGESLEEARENLIEAVKMVIEANNNFPNPLNKKSSTILRHIEINENTSSQRRKLQL